jgi:very-short-patch-repair endonuclease
MKLYTGWLTEEKLGRALEIMYDAEFIHGRAFPGYRFRPDYINHDLKLVVEYNGHLHYTVAKSVLDDDIKRQIMEKEGYRVIQIPYFVQIDNRVMNKLFNVYKENIEFTDFPHGFISEKCILPADFCSLGLQRIHIEMDLFDYIREEISYSLEKKVEDLHELLVMPCIRMSCGCSFI